MGDDDLLTTDEVLTYLRVNRATVYRLARAGRIPAVHVGSVWRFPRKEIEAWVEAGGTKQFDVRTGDGEGHEARARRSDQPPTE